MEGPEEADDKDEVNVAVAMSTMAAVVTPIRQDLPQLSSFLSIPEAKLGSLVESPTTVLVTTLLDHVARKLLEHEQLRADKIKLEIELENAVLLGESRAHSLKGSVDKGLKEVAELRKQLQHEGWC